MQGYPKETLENEEQRPPRGLITEFSRKSRRRLMNRLAIIDQRRAGLPAFLSLTYPDESLPVDERTVKRHLNAFRMAYVRRFGKRPVLWRRELQTRKSGRWVGEKAPHFHLLTWGVEPTDEDRYWCADTWVRVVGSESAEHWQVTAHAKSWFMPDSWRGTLAYVSKYTAKVSDEVCAGRSWGWWSPGGLPVQLLSDEIPSDAFHAVRRVLRAYIGKRCKGHRPPIYHRWQGLSAYLSEAMGAKLVKWAWDIGWEV